MHSTQARFGQRVRELRKQKNLSQEALAGKSGLHVTYIGSLERGERNPSLMSMQKIAKGLGIPLPELLLFPEGKSEKELLKKRIAELIAPEDTRTLRLCLRVLRALLEK